MHSSNNYTQFFHSEDLIFSEIDRHIVSVPVCCTVGLFSVWAGCLRCGCACACHMLVTICVNMSEVWGPHIMGAGGSHSGPHHSHQFCLMFMQCRHHERERLFELPAIGSI